MMRAPTVIPVSRSLRKAADHSASLGSTGCSNAKTRLVTAPVEVITTTITSCGWSTSTST